MRVRIMLMALLLIAAAVPRISAEEAGREQVKKGIKSEKSSAADFLASFWSKIVRSGKKKSSAVPTAVAGLRGEEQEKEKELTPYWKGKEKSKDGPAMTEIEALINKKEYAGAIEALKSFGPSYPDSPLKPTSVLMLGYCYTQTGKEEAAKLAFEGFLKDYPNHELAADAKAGIEILKGVGK